MYFTVFLSMYQNTTEKELTPGENTSRYILLKGKYHVYVMDLYKGKNIGKPEKVFFDNNKIHIKLLLYVVQS